VGIKIDLKKFTGKVSEADSYMAEGVTIISVDHAGAYFVRARDVEDAKKKVIQHFKHLGTVRISRWACWDIQEITLLT
jgi:hypothetical protein